MEMDRSHRYCGLRGEMAMVEAFREAFAVSGVNEGLKRGRDVNA